MAITANDIIVPPPPYQSPFTDKSGLITPAWSKWINQLFLRAGGTSAPSPAGIISSITTLQSNVATIQNEITTINTQIAPGLEGLTLGRQL